jgi:hypothetical protein
MVPAALRLGHIEPAEKNANENNDIYFGRTLIVFRMGAYLRAERSDVDRNFHGSVEYPTAIR